MTATLADVLRSLQGDLLRAAYVGEDAPLSEVTIYDPGDASALQPGALVLAVGVAVTEREAIALIQRAQRAGAVAVTFRSEGAPPGPLADAAAACGVALLTVGREVGWGQVHALLRSALVSAGATDESGTLGVRVGDLFALADAIAAAVGGPVTIEDPQLRVLAYSNLDQPIDDARRQTILGRVPPLAWQKRLDEAGVSRHLRSGDGVVRFSGEGLAVRLAVPVRAGSETLGAVWVAEGDEPLGEHEQAELERLAPLVAVHLLAHRSFEDVRRRTLGAFMREVLDGHVPASGIGGDGLPRLQGPFTVIVFEADGEPSASPGRLLGVVSLYAEALHRDAMCAYVDGRYWALIPTADGAARGRAADAAQLIVERVQRTLGVALHAGVGSSVPRLSDVPRSRSGAERALTIAARQARGPVVRIDDVQAHAVLLELLELAEARPTLLQGRLQALLDHDSTHGSDYAQTLRAYLDAGCDVRRTGERLGLHPNSVRYRVRRLVEISGLDLSDPDERLVAELQLRILEAGRTHQ